MINFSGKTAIVTGGTRGIGKCVAKLLAREGCRVFYTGTSRRASDPYYIQLDLTDKNSIRRFLNKIKSIGQVDILINNAGINIIEPINKLSNKNWEKIMAVNLTGSMMITRDISRIMIKKNKGGRIVNVSSILGVVSKEKRSSYSASKAGLIGLTRASALDLAPYSIMVNAVCPGFISTDLTESVLTPSQMRSIARDIPLGRFGSVSEIAYLIVFLCSDLNTYMTGQTVIVDGGFTAK